jgi:hypothetical protein
MDRKIAVRAAWVAKHAANDLGRRQSYPRRI